MAMKCAAGKKVPPKTQLFWVKNKQTKKTPTSGKVAVCLQQHYKRIHPVTNTYNLFDSNDQYLLSIDSGDQYYLSCLAC